MTEFDCAVPAGEHPSNELTDDLSQPPDIVEVWGYDSFPASDPPANW